MLCICDLFATNIYLYKLTVSFHEKNSFDLFLNEDSILSTSCSYITLPMYVENEHMLIYIKEYLSHMHIRTYFRCEITCDKIYAHK